MQLSLRIVGIGLLGIIGTLVYTCNPTYRSVIGAYISNNTDDPAVLIIEKNGSFSEIEAGKQIGTGTWRLNSSSYIEQYLELNGLHRLSLQETATGISKEYPSGSYELIHRGGRLCIDIDQELLVWCKQ